MYLYIDILFIGVALIGIGLLLWSITDDRKD